MAYFGPERARGVAVPEKDISDDELRRLHDETEHIGLKSAQPSIDEAITALSVDQSSR